MINEKISEIVKKLAKRNQKIATMESCTGGGLANAITNVSGSSEVFNFTAVTYSNEFKIKMGVSEKVIEEFSVYSKETANEMSKAIADFTSADYGIGITGKLRSVDPNNNMGEDDVVFVSVFDKKNNLIYTNEVVAEKETRAKNKDLVILAVANLLQEILK
ncbi:MAG: CinA family protein [Clostridia bacterium]|nr:CinA family protein [Clostridia bacterium]